MLWLLFLDNPGAVVGWSLCEGHAHVPLSPAWRGPSLMVTDDWETKEDLNLGASVFQESGFAQTAGRRMVSPTEAHAFCDQAGTGTTLHLFLGIII